MSRLLATVLSALLFCGTPVRAEPVQPSSTAGLPQWERSGAVGQASGMRIDLVRADVTIVTSTDDRPTVKIVAEGSSGGPCKCAPAETLRNVAVQRRNMTTDRKLKLYV